ncbi:MAG: methylated-DNA--[protein]-cysteine S-methyltransferase [Planctomycetaceae bacterium]
MIATIACSHDTQYCSTYDSALGQILLRSDGDCLTGLYFPTQLKEVAGRDRWVVRDDCFDDAKRYLDRYFGGAQCGDPPSLRPKGTPFQKTVWNRLRSIGFGQTRTYGEIARDIGKPSASRAVGRAIGDNPISLIVPCHRVIGGNGNLTGYAGGLEIKRWLLDHEARAS